MAGLTPGARMLLAAGLALMLAWPNPARAGWFVRDNAIAYDLVRQGQDRQALAHWDLSAKGLYGRGTTLMHLGRIREAEQAFREALALAPRKTGFSDQLAMPVNRRPHFMASVWYNLGNALYAQDELVAARDAWIKALGFEPGHAKAKRNLAIVDRLLGARERREAPTPAGLPGHVKRKPAGGSQAASPQSSPPPQQKGERKQAPGTPGSGQQKKAAGKKHAGAGQGGNRPHRASAPHPSRDSGHAGSGSGGSRKPEPAKGAGMSRDEAVQQLRLVEEGVSVFLRHRLSEKGRGSSAQGGKPW